MQCCCPWLFARARPTGTQSEHRKLAEIADVETGAAASDDEEWDDFDKPSVTTVTTSAQAQRPKSLYGLDDEVTMAPVVDDDPFKDLGMAPAIQRPKIQRPSHLASVWAEDRPTAGASAFAMDTMDLGDTTGGGGWADDSLDMTELQAEGRRAAQERREAIRRAAQAQPTGTPRGKLHAVRTMGPMLSDADGVDLRF